MDDTARPSSLTNEHAFGVDDAPYLRSQSCSRPGSLQPRPNGSLLPSAEALSVLELNCPDVNVFHVVVWHWGVVLISTAAGVLIGTAVEYIQRQLHPKTS